MSKLLTTKLAMNMGSFSVASRRMYFRMKAYPKWRMEPSSIVWHRYK